MAALNEPAGAAGDDDEKAREPSEAEKQQVARWNKRIQRAIKATKARRAVNALNRKYVLGRQNQDDASAPDPDEVRANLILGIMQTLIPLYYSKDPELDISPAERVQGHGYEAIERFAQTLDIVLRREMIREGKLKKRITRAISAAMTTGLCWLKGTLQENYREDPIAKNRLNDAQDNLARIEHLIRETREKNGDCADLEAKKAELDQMVAQVQGRVEILVGKAFAIDVVLEEDLLVLDESLVTFSEYPQAEALAHCVWMSCEQYEERFGHKPTGTKYADKMDDREAGVRRGRGKDDNVEAQQFVRVVEIWDRRAGTVYTMEVGAKQWARAPYVPRASRRFYPFFAVFWNEFDSDPDSGDIWPVSDVEQMRGLQDEYISMRTQLVQARRENMPGFIARAGGAITEEDANNIANRRARRVVFINTNGSQAPLNQDIAPYPQSPIDGASYDSTPILRDLEQVSGASDASRASINRAKTATEAEIQAQGMQSRTAYRQDVIEDLIGEMAEHGAQLMVQSYSVEEVKRIAGPDAQWPDQPRPDYFESIYIQVRSGTTGKPNQNRERERWTQLAPQILDFMKMVREYRAMGDTAAADGVIELLRQTLRRFDERIDIDQFFQTAEPMADPMMMAAAGGMPPPGMPGPGGMPPMPPGPPQGAPMPPIPPMPPGPPQQGMPMPGGPMPPPAGPQLPAPLPPPPGSGPDGMAAGLQQYVAGIYQQAANDAGAGVQAMQAAMIQQMQMMAETMARFAAAMEQQAAIARAPRVPVRDPQSGDIVAVVPDLDQVAPPMPQGLPMPAPGMPVDPNAMVQ